MAERLGVRTQSLYSHVDGLDGLRRELALHAVRELGAVLTDAAMGRAGAEAMRYRCVASIPAGGVCSRLRQR